MSRVIRAPFSEVYDFVADPMNLPRWAAGLTRTKVTRRGDALVADSPMGEVVVRFVPRNDFGVVDHDVTLPSGQTVNNPFRVLPHPDGAEVLFTVRQLGMGDEEYARDCRLVAEDLDRLAALLEA